MASGKVSLRRIPDPRNRRERVRLDGFKLLLGRLTKDLFHRHPFTNGRLTNAVCQLVRKYHLESKAHFTIIFNASRTPPYFPNKNFNIVGTLRAQLRSEWSAPMAS